MIIETHCHLDYLDTKELEETLKESRRVGIEKIITISVEPNNFDKVLKLANQNEMVFCTQGIHPHDAKEARQKDLELIKERQSLSKVVAVGEIGLDYHYNNSPKAIQLKVFEEQLNIAAETNQPVVIHSRDADDDMARLLKEFAPKLNKKGVVHSFTSGPQLAQTALDLGFYLGFNGIITFKNAEEVRDIVRMTPIKQILFETDSPYLTPVPHRGKENNPSYLPFIIEKIAEIKNVDINELKEQVYQNSKTLFNLP